MGEKPQVIKKRNERVREELATDLEALGEKLDVKSQIRHKKDDVLGRVRGKVGMSHHSGNGNGHEASGGEAILQIVRHHPLATIALGYGAKTLLSSWNEQHAHRSSYKRPLTDRATGLASGVGERASGLASGAGDAATLAGVRASELKDSAEDAATMVGVRASEVKDAAGEWTQQARQQLPSSADELNQTIRHNFTAFSIGALAAGAILGLLAPKTRLEDENLGPIRENIVDTVQEQAGNAKEAVQQGVRTGVETTREEITAGSSS